MTSATAAAQPAAPWSAGLPRPADPSHPIAAPDPALQALVVLARLHHVSADAELLAHQLGLPGGRASNASDLLQAAHPRKR